MTLTEAGGQEKNKFGRAFDAINAAFPDEHWVLDTASLLDFSGDAIETIQKRDSPIIGFPGCDNPPPDPTNLPKLTSVPKPPAPKPTFTVPTPPDHPGGDRPDFAHTCIDKNMEGIKSTDRSILTEAISLGCGSRMIVSPVNFNMSKERISNQYPFDRVYIHMTHKYSDNQDGCMPQVLNSDPKLDSKGNWDPLAPRRGINFDDCQNTMMYIVDNCEYSSYISPAAVKSIHQCPLLKKVILDHEWQSVYEQRTDYFLGNTDTVTEKWGGAMRWNSPTGCMDFYLWIPTEPDLVPLK